MGPIFLKPDAVKAEVLSKDLLQFLSPPALMLNGTASRNVDRQNTIVKLKLPH